MVDPSFFFNNTGTTDIYTLSLHDALPIWAEISSSVWLYRASGALLSSRSMAVARALGTPGLDRKSTRLNSSHANISYAVFCLKKKTSLTLAFRVQLGTRKTSARHALVRLN